MGMVFACGRMAQHSLETGFMISYMVRVYCGIPGVTPLLESSKMVNSAALVCIKPSRVPSMRVSGLLTCKKDKARRLGPMDQCTLAIITSGNSTATESTSRLTIALTKDSGTRTRCQERAFINGLTVAPTKVLGLETKCMVRERWFGPMAECTLAASRMTREKATANFVRKME